MSLCINPSCKKPENPNNILFCLTCGSGLLLQDCYRVIVKLGSGGFGDTFEINEVRTNKAKVLKVLTNNNRKAIELFKQEAAVLSQLHHPGIPQVETDAYFEYYPRSSQNPIHCLVMEKIEGMDLREYMQKRDLRPINQTTAIAWLKDLLTILAQVHNQNFFHRDIKPSNIMLRAENAQLVLIDFGTVREVTNTVFQQQGRVTTINSGGYTPTEQINGNAVPQSDFFALGRTFVYLLTGKEPLDPEIYDSYHATFNWRNHAPKISKMLADLLDDMMQFLYKDRPQTVNEIWHRLAEVEKSLQPNKSKTFNFEVVTTDATGKITNRRNASAKYFTEDLGNGVFLEMVEIPGGTFMMGSPENEAERRSNESPQHQVTVPSFCMGKYELTQAQYQAIMGNNPARFKGNNRPVEKVSWNDAVAFCEKLSQRTGKKYRLPSEAEWEYACRAGTTTRFYFGESITPELVNYNLNNHQTTDVGTFPPNAFGLYDMHGNVWEWCQDNYERNYINAPMDGAALTSSSVWEVLRGGSWYVIPVNCRSAFRLSYFLAYDSDIIGFRVVCSGAART